MRKVSISATLMVFCAFASGVAGAAYPVYQNYQGAQNVPMYQQQYQQQMGGQYNGNYVAPGYVQLPATNSTVLTVNSAVAAAPTRVTGALPQVGSSAAAAGRRYYQPADYDRLSDTGLYIGLSASYTASIMGSMKADYIGETSNGNIIDYTVPGAFAAASYENDTMIPLQVSLGASVNNDLRIDFSYTRYSGLSYPNKIYTADYTGVANVLASVEGGAITANTTMINLYYNLDSYTGYLAGGSLRPYVGVGVGVSLNTIADYVVYDSTFYTIIEDLNSTVGEAGLLTGVSDIYAYHNGGTNEQLAFMLEGGITSDLGGGIKLDFFARYANLGRVKTSGSIVLSQTEWLSDGYGSEVQADYDSVFHYTNWYESGRLAMVDIGARLRLQF
ncbi:MAG: hypothetical protein J5613_03650 [Alphaproteobacteria bacterium]|nr:hypothetical protein [Alphaproteobacteria bacterium]